MYIFSFYFICMVAQCYQTRFCNLNTIFILKLDSNSVLNNNFTFKLVLIFNSEVKINFNFNYKINSKVKCISNPDLNSKSIPNLNHKINSKVKMYF